MKKGITIRQVAFRAGCSHTAVSMALRNHPGVSQETRDRIRRIAEEMGYSRDSLVSSLMGQLRTKKEQRERETVGIINCWDTREGDRTTHLGKELHAGITQRVAALGYRMDYFWAKERGMSARRLSRILQARGIRGILLLSMPHAHAHIPLEWDRFAAASVGYGLYRPELHRVNYSHYHAMVLALRTLRQMGFRRIGFTNRLDQEDMVNNERLSAYLGFHYRVLGTAPPPALLVKDWEPAATAEWLREARPEVVVSSNPAPYHILRKIGYRVPEDLNFVNLDAVPNDLPCAGIRQPRNEVGAKAIDLVVEQLEKHDFGVPTVAKVVLVKGFWQDGPTLIPRRPAPQRR